MATDRHERPEPMMVGPAALKALTHPLRVQMYDLLADQGAATASRLAEQLGESSGSTSYHLRILARHGFIEEDPDRGNRRDRWWRVKPGGFTLEAETFSDDPQASADLQMVASEFSRNHARHLERWYRSADRWGEPWVSSSASRTMRFEGTVEEMAELRDQVAEVMESFHARIDERPTPEGSVRIMAQFHLFPADEPPGGGKPRE